MIECKIKKVENPAYHSKNKEQKDGIYSQTMHWGVKGYGKKSWVVIVKIVLDYENAKLRFKEDDRIITECIKFLNTPQKSKYGKRRMKKLPYSFHSDPCGYKITTDNGEKIIAAQLVVKEQKNKHFWKSGPLV